jgi:cytochrome c-type biogenesis protein CcmH/NrfG
MDDVATALRKAELEFPAPAKPLTATPPLASNEAQRARSKPAASTEPLPTLALNEDVAALDTLPKSGSQEHFSENRQTSDEGRSFVQPTIASTVALTQPVEAITKKKSHWKWLLIGGTALPIAIVAVWAAFTFYRKPADQIAAKPPPVLEAERPPAKTTTSAVISADTKELSQDPASAPRLVSLAIQAGRHELNVNARLALRVRGKYSDGKEGEIKTVRWESSDSSIATVNARGEISGQREGKVQVIARSGDVASDPVRLTVKSSAQGEAQPSKSSAKKLAPNKAKDEQTAKGSQTKEHVRMARLYRERGDYAEAFAELEKAGKIDPRNTEVQGEIAATKRACVAERTLGRSDLNCG